MTNTVSQALELDPVESHLHPVGSFDVADHPVPSGLEEVWRFTPLRRLRDLHKEAPLHGEPLKTTAELAPGVSGQWVQADKSIRGLTGYVPVDRVSARAWQASSSVYEVTIPAETVLDEASTITLHGTGSDTAGAGHTVIRAGAFSKASVVVRYTGSATLAENIEVALDDGAQLTLITLHDWDRDAVHVVTQHARIGRDASLRHIAVSLGGDLVRASTSADYVGSGGAVDLLGLYFADAGQHIEHRLLADHTAPNTKSNVEYKGALQGKDSHTVWVGNILIRKVAEGTDTYEQNDNLVLTPGAIADSIPNLEIETGEIEGAGHASTTGRFDEEHLFYLRSRGIAEADARALVVRGFFNSIIRRIGIDAVEERLRDAIEQELTVTLGAVSE